MVVNQLTYKAWRREVLGSSQISKGKKSLSAAKQNISEAGYMYLRELFKEKLAVIEDTDENQESRY